MVRQTTVLVIDDSPTQARSFAMMLDRQGLNALVTTDGSEGLRLARSLRPNAVLIDLRLPGMDGLEICRALRADPRTSAIPVMILTAITDPLLLSNAQEAGASSVIHKDMLSTERILEALAEHGLLAPAAQG